MRHPYATFAHEVERPARYLGGEYLSVTKDPAQVDAQVVLAFPDVYEIGMSHLGTKILYSLLNKQPRILAERAFTPWVDMEAALRRRGLPLVSLESARPLSAFDVLGISLQYELTYTNALTLLDLGGVALHACDRPDDAPLVLGGGPTSSHPEPMAPFFDAFFVGEAEEELPGLVLEWAAMRRGGRARLDALAELAARYPLYVPALYDTEVDPVSELVVVGAPRDPRAPRRIRRGFVADLNTYPFPSDSPVPYAEAVFDRAAIEIARGCTEGCRFCQAGMLYRPVRERSPDSIVETLIGQVDKGGYDETSLTSLSTADYSCITPLVKTVMGKLRAKKVALGVSSLRAYGLNEDLLDEMASVRATGLTFAPEAGTQRMRDVVNKNVTEDHIRDSADRVFRRGWNRLKLYFMIGLPTETDEDVRGIVATGARMLEIGKRHVGGDAEVTVAVSSHVPKPHTPFQWAAMDPLEVLDRKQRLLRRVAAETRPQVRLKYHEKGISHVEGVMARGDRRVAGAVEAAWRDGARFDGWDELFDLERWRRAFAASGVEPARYLGTIAVRARLPWDHIDIGLEDGFLLSEYRRALKNRLSPPCGKPVGSLIHHTNVADAVADERRLVCYDCGVACDMGGMRDERLVYLRALGADEPAPPPAERPRAGRRAPRPKIEQGPGERYRLRYVKQGRAAFIGHIDVMRLLARVFRRAGVAVGYTLGYHPKPNMTFGPALALGVPSFGELFDVRLDGVPEPDELVARLNEVAPEGLVFRAARRVPDGEPGLAKRIVAADFALAPVADVDLEARAAAFLALGSAPVARGIDARPAVLGLDPLDAPGLARALGWRERPMLRARLRVSAEGSVRPVELAELLELGGADIARLGLLGEGGADPFDPPAAVPARALQPA
jgi:radical SAM family uncharacterized protein/radical SAM-linked protein